MDDDDVLELLAIIKSTGRHEIKRLGDLSKIEECSQRESEGV